MTRVIETVTEPQYKNPCRSAAQMTALCCEKKPELTCCEKTEIWNGYTDEEIKKNLGIVVDSQGRDAQGRIVVIERLPRNGPCGEKVTKYDLTAKNCCDKVTPLAFDHSATPEILPHGRSIIIAWTGSDGREVTVTTSSNATWFSDGRKTAIGHGHNIELFAGPTFCGATSVTVTDHCSKATVVLRSDLGRWVDQGPICALQGIPITTPLSNHVAVGNCGYGENAEVILGKYKQVETVRFCGIDVGTANPAGCVNSLSEECFSCIGQSVTCAQGQAYRPPGNYPTCLGFPNNMLGIPSGTVVPGESQSGHLQAFCGGHDYAIWGYQTTLNLCVNLNNVYGYLESYGIKLYEWTC